VDLPRPAHAAEAAAVRTHLAADAAFAAAAFAGDAGLELQRTLAAEPGFTDRQFEFGLDVLAGRRRRRRTAPAARPATGRAVSAALLEEVAEQVGEEIGEAATRGAAATAAAEHARELFG